MPREHADYRNNIEQLNRHFPEKEMLTIADVMKIYGCKSPNTVRSAYGRHMVRGKISKATLARLMCS